MRSNFNEADWLNCNDPVPMIQAILPIASDRKLRLFVAACARRLWDLLEDSRSCRMAVEVAELYADSTASIEELNKAHETCVHYAGSFGFSHLPAAASYADLRSLVPEVPSMVIAAIAEIEEFPDTHTNLEAMRSERATNERSAQCEFLRDIFSSPFADSVQFGWSERHGEIRALAEQMYNLRRFDGMPLVAEKLRDAGYADDRILTHCRQVGSHVRGCWVVDQILGKG